MDIFLLWLPMALYAVAMISVLVYSRAVATEDEYFLALRRVGRNQSFISVVATETSVATIVLFPAAGFTSGLVLLWLCAGYIVGRWIVATFYLEKIYREHRLSLYQTVSGESHLSRRVISSFYLLAKFISSGVRFYMAGYALQQFFGWSVVGWMFVTAVLVGAYSLLGGLRAVVIVDHFYATVIILMGLYLCGRLFLDLPAGAVFAPEWMRTDLRPENSLHFAALLIGGAVLSIGTHGADQDTLQRVLATARFEEARHALILSGLGATLVILCYLLAGYLLKLSFFGAASLNAKSPLVDYISLAHNPFFTGCFAVTLFAASLSTLDSAIHATGAVWKDLLDSKISGRYFSFLSLAILVGAGILFREIDRLQRGDFLDLAMGSMNYVNGGMIGIFTVYTFFPRYLDAAGVLLALPGGFAVTFACNWLVRPPLAWSWGIVLASAVAFALCIAGGALQRRFAAPA